MIYILNLDVCFCHVPCNGLYIIINCEFMIKILELFRNQSIYYQRLLNNGVFVKLIILYLKTVVII